MHGEVMREMGLRSNMFAADAEGDEQREKKDKMNAKSTKVLRSVWLSEILPIKITKIVCSRRRRGEAMNLIRRFKHELYTIEVNKKALSPDDDKRYILEDGISTLP